MKPIPLGVGNGTPRLGCFLRPEGAGGTGRPGGSPATIRRVRLGQGHRTMPLASYRTPGSSPEGFCPACGAAQGVRLSSWERVMRVPCNSVGVAVYLACFPPWRSSRAISTPALTPVQSCSGFLAESLRCNLLSRSGTQWRSHFRCTETAFRTDWGSLSTREAV